MTTTDFTKTPGYYAPVIPPTREQQHRAALALATIAPDPDSLATVLNRLGITEGVRP